jgi:hypothetical protein
VLICPGDRNHSVASSWETFTESENVSYEFLLPGAKETDAVSKAAFRCPIHNNVAMGDGSVQQGRRY